MSEFHIVTIDDNNVELELLSQILNNIDNVVVHAFNNAYDALNQVMVLEIKANLVLCDWSMPGMNGFSFLKAFRTMDKSTPFIMVTSHTEKNFVMESKQAGATGYIAKPYSSRRLIAKVEKYKTDMECRHVA